MLAADRSAVETDLQAQAVQIKNIEMNNIDRYLQAIGKRLGRGRVHESRGKLQNPYLIEITSPKPSAHHPFRTFLRAHTFAAGTQAALICGFAASESWALEKWNTQYTPWWLIICYYITNIVSLICEMYCVMNATLVSVLGPTFALNGPQGSMHESVKAMKEERLNILTAFITGAVSFGICQVFTVWIIAPLETSIPVTGLLALGFFYIQQAMTRIKKKFKYDEIYAGNDDGRGSTATNKRSSLYENVFGAQPESPTSRPMKAQAFLSQKRYPGTMLEKDPTPHSNSRGQINLNTIEYP